MHCIYGEYVVPAFQLFVLLGSPPHTRGISELCVAERMPNRFTPAYAGNIQLLMGLDEILQVHPRIRGEYPLPSYFPPFCAGSPPHTRGISCPFTGRISLIRFTPAYAGNMKLSRLFISSGRVHPRIRGEYSRRKAGDTMIRGSPPHTRGISV